MEALTAMSAFSAGKSVTSCIILIMGTAYAKGSIDDDPTTGTVVKVLLIMALAIPPLLLFAVFVQIGRAHV